LTAPLIVGVDFDNTLICYDELFYEIACAEALIPTTVPANKGAIREHLRSEPGGEARWQWLQAAAYGTQIDRARVMPGALEFLRRCEASRIAACVVSHKGERAAANPEGPNLRTRALDWLEQNGFFSPDTGLGPASVHFGATLHEKLALVASLGCTHFIDDLDDVFREPSFPARVTKILFAPAGDFAPRTLPADVLPARSWANVEAIVFARAD
jgi:hypothetical protein